MTMSIALGIGAGTIVAGIALAVQARKPQSKSPFRVALDGLATAKVQELMNEVQIAAYPGYAAVEAVRHQGSRSNRYSKMSASQLQKELARALEELSGGIQYIRLYNALELTELGRTPEQILAWVRSTRGDSKNLLDRLAGIWENQLSPLERNKIDRSRAHQILCQNRGLLGEFAAAEALLKQGQDLLALLAKSQAQAA